MIVAGNPYYNVGKEIFKIYPDAVFCSRNSGYNLTTKDNKLKFAEQSLKHDIVLIVSALKDFHIIDLYDTVYNHCIEKNHKPHIITIGSTIDRLSNGNGRLYATEKRALRDHTINLNLNSHRNGGPKTTLLSFGMLENMKKKFPNNKCISLELVGYYIKWIVEQPRHININEINIDPLQDQFWHTE